MQLKQVIEEVKRQRKFLNQDTDNAPAATRNALEGRKKMAKRNIDELFFHYRKAVLPSITPIIVTGSKAEEFAVIAKKETELDYLSSDALYEKISQKLDPKMLGKGKESSAYVLEVAGRYLEETATEMGVASYPQLVYRQAYAGKIASQQEAKELIKRAMRDQVGAEMATLFLLDHASRLAFEDIDSKFHPVTVVAKSQADVEDVVKSLNIYKNLGVIVVAGDSEFQSDLSDKEVTEKTVLSVLKQVKKKVVKK